MITIAVIRDQIRQIVDPLIIKLRQEIYGPGNTFGQYIADSKIPPTIPRTTPDTTGTAAITGSGKVNFIPLWTGDHTLGNSQLFQASGTIIASGMRFTGLSTQSTGTSVGLDTNNNLVKLTTVAGGISSVPQRFGWYIDQDPDIGVNGPIYFFNTDIDVLEYNIFFKGTPQTPFVFRVEMTDNYNPTYNGVGVVWWNLLAANGNSGAQDTTIAAGTVTQRIVLSPEITPLSRNSGAQAIGQGIAPSGAYGIWMRLYVVSGGLSTGVTMSMLLRSNGSV